MGMSSLQPAQMLRPFFSSLRQAWQIARLNSAEILIFPQTEHWTATCFFCQRSCLEQRSQSCLALSRITLTSLHRAQGLRPFLSSLEQSPQIDLADRTDFRIWPQTEHRIWGGRL